MLSGRVGDIKKRIQDCFRKIILRSFEEMLILGFFQMQLCAERCHKQDKLYLGNPNILKFFESIRLLNILIFFFNISKNKYNKT